MSMATEIKLGEITVHRVVEQEAPIFPPLEFFPALTAELLAENLPWLSPKYIDPATGKLVLCVQSYLLRTPQHTILIDSCVGNHKPRPARPFWNMLSSDRYEKNLAAAGVGVGDIDYVMCTHLHVDHVGWNTRLENGRWVPTFPNAKYLFADRELEHWTAQEKQNPANFPWITDSVLPIVAAGRHEAVTSDYRLNELVQLVPTPGHTIDHFSVHVGKAGQDAFITGDMIHSPIQARYPDLSPRVDYKPEQAAASRRKVFERFCDTSTLVCTAHFPSPSMGRITRWGEGFKFVSV
jgi:glyoxylase-like metal-dependent hydrolase (beta-lactamase superfamily II)